MSVFSAINTHQYKENAYGIIRLYPELSQRNGTLYIGVSTHLIQRIYQHKTKAAAGFTSKYKVDSLVYYEIHDNVREAIAREKMLKKWKREWKIDLIEQNNPNWDDLYYTLWG